MTLMTTTLQGLKALQEASRAGLKVKTMVGGAAVRQQWADKLGAHAYGKNTIRMLKNYFHDFHLSLT